MLLDQKNRTLKTGQKLEQTQRNCHTFVFFFYLHLYFYFLFSIPASGTCCLLPTCRDFFVHHKKNEVGVSQSNPQKQ